MFSSAKLFIFNNLTLFQQSLLTSQFFFVIDTKHPAIIFVIDNFPHRPRLERITLRNRLESVIDFEPLPTQLIKHCLNFFISFLTSFRHRRLKLCSSIICKNDTRTCNSGGKHCMSCRGSQNPPPPCYICITIRETISTQNLHTYTCDQLPTLLKNCGCNTAAHLILSRYAGISISSFMRPPFRMIIMASHDRINTLQ